MSSGMMASTAVAGDDVAMAADSTASGDSTAPLPQSVAYVPVVKPGSGFPALQDGTTRAPRPRYRGRSSFNPSGSASGGL